MSIHARDLLKTSNLEGVNHLVNDHLATIRDRIQVVNQHGGHELFYELPDQPSCGNLETSEVQLILYTRLIEKLEEKELNVNVIYNENTHSSKLRINWKSALDPAEMKRMKEILAKHTVKE